MMPIELVLVRHGQSEGNVANKESRKGNNEHFTDDFRNRHSSTWRLSDLGQDQAHAAGVWLRDNIDLPFDRYYTSEYYRAMETSALLDLPRAKWFVEFYLRERDWGDMDVLPQDEREAKFTESLKKREQDAFFWKPPNGESLADLCLRMDRVLHTLHRECSDKRVIIVCHGEAMWAFRVRLERISQERFRELDLSDNPHDHIHNCQIMHYSRRNPEDGTLSNHLDWMRSVCPTDLSLSSNEWQPIVRSRYSNRVLLGRVRRVSRMVS